MQAEAIDDARRRILRIAEDAGFDDSIGGFATNVFENAVEEGAVERTQERSRDGRFSGDERVYPPASYPAAVYAAARIRDVPTKPGELADAVDYDVEADEVADVYREIIKALPFKVEPEDPSDWVRRICESLDAPNDFVDEAASLCADAVDKNLHSGKSVSGFAGAVVYATAKLTDAPIDQDDVADAADVSPVTIRNQYRDVLALREGEVAQPGDDQAIDRSIGDICDAVDGMPGVVRNDALSMASELPDVDWVRRTNPRGVAAGLVYVAAKDNRVDVSQTEVGDVAGVHKGTVINRVKDVREWQARRKFDGVEYNRLKQLAADNGVDVGQTPERDYLIGKLIDADVEP